MLLTCKVRVLGFCFLLLKDFVDSLKNKKLNTYKESSTTLSKAGS